MVEASTVVCWLKNIMTVVTHVHMVAGGDGTVKSNVTSQWARAPRRRVYSACAAFTWHAHPSYRLGSSSNYRPILVLPQIKKTSHTVSTLLLSTSWPAGSFGEHGIPMFTKTDSWPSSGMYMAEKDNLPAPAGNQWSRLYSLCYIFVTFLWWLAFYHVTRKH